MPSARAMAQACCPPAPPKQASTWCEVSWPLAWVRERMGRHMLSLATRMKPMATCSTVSGEGGPGAWPAREAFTRAVSAWKASQLASRASGWSSPGPKMRGK